MLDLWGQSALFTSQLQVGFSVWNTKVESASPNINHKYQDRMMLIIKSSSGFKYTYFFIFYLCQGYVAAGKRVCVCLLTVMNRLVKCWSPRKSWLKCAVVLDSRRTLTCDCLKIKAKGLIIKQPTMLHDLVLRMSLYLLYWCRSWYVRKWAAGGLRLNCVPFY